MTYFACGRASRLINLRKRRLTG